MMKKLQKKLNSDGFTILEVMVGLVIFSIGLLTLLSMVVISISGNSWSDKTTQTVQMVRQTIEEVKNTPEDQLMSFDYADVNGVFYHWMVEDSYEDPGLKRMTIWVYWYDDLNRPQYTSTTTYFQPKQ